MDENKTIQLFTIIANQTGGIFNKISALHLIWLCDRLYLKRFDETITKNEYYANIDGVIPFEAQIMAFSDLKYKRYIKPYYIDFYKTEGILDMSIFNEDELSCIDDILNFYGKFNYKELRKLSMSFPEFEPYSDIILMQKWLNIKLTDEELKEPFNDTSGLFQ